MRITVAGMGYVGLANAVLLSQHNAVTALDVVAEKVALLNKRQSPIQDTEIQDYLSNKILNLKATLDKEEAYANAEYVIVATPTNYDPKSNYFDTSSVESVIQDVATFNPSACIIIKSTVPVGFTKQISAQHSNLKIIFSQSFCAKAKPCTTTFIPAASSLARAANTQKPSPHCCKKGQSSKKFPHYLLIAPKRKPSSYFPTPTWPCA